MNLDLQITLLDTFLSLTTFKHKIETRISNDVLLVDVFIVKKLPAEPEYIELNFIVDEDGSKFKEIVDEYDEM